MLGCFLWYSSLYWSTFIKVITLASVWFYSFGWSLPDREVLREGMDQLATGVVLLHRGSRERVKGTSRLWTLARVVPAHHFVVVHCF